MKNIAIAILSAFILMSFSSCFFLLMDWETDSAPEENLGGSLSERLQQQTQQGNQQPSTLGETVDGWTMYWYLCGSDLESDIGAATEDLEEMMEVAVPDNVTVVIQTGGAYYWNNNYVDGDVTQRFVYDSNGLTLVEQLPIANMGASETFADFLRFATQNYPSEHSVLNLWNHGGGSIGGIAFDENYDMDSLSLIEMDEAFYSVFGSGLAEKPFDIIGFDACLMASIDTAHYMSPYGDYMIASEDTMPQVGWDYTALMNSMGAGLSPLDLAVDIADDYIAHCDEYYIYDGVTMSVVDLAAVGALVEAYDNFGAEALSAAVQDPAFFTHLSQVAHNIKTFGGSVDDYGFSNMADLGHFAEQAAQILPQTYGELLAALDASVVYNLYGDYSENSNGLSCFYSYDSDLFELSEFESLGTSSAFSDLFNYGMTGNLAPDAYEQIYPEINIPEYEIEQPFNLEVVDWEDYPVYIDDDGYSVLDLGPSAYDILATVTYELYYYSIEDDIMLSLGSDNDMLGDWNSGVFRENFRGVWGSIDGALCYMEIVYEGDTYNEYSVPIMLNGERYNLSVIYDYDAEEYVIEGARKPQNEGGAPDKNLRLLEVGDVIQTIHYASPISDEEAPFEEVVIDTVNVNANTSFYDTDLGDGTFLVMYAMTDSRGTIAYSVPVYYEQIDGDLYASVD